jgi:hypothetical protein
VGEAGSVYSREQSIPAGSPLSFCLRTEAASRAASDRVPTAMFRIGDMHRTFIEGAVPEGQEPPSRAARAPDIGLNAV